MQPHDLVWRDGMHGDLSHQGDEPWRARYQVVIAVHLKSERTAKAPQTTDTRGCQLPLHERGHRCSETR